MDPMTIQVYRGEDLITINEEDFDPAIHERAEERSTKKLSGRLPEEFPGFDALQKADITTYAQVRKARKDGVKVEGIGDAIGAQIDQVLAAGAPE